MTTSKQKNKKPTTLSLKTKAAPVEDKGNTTSDIDAIPATNDATATPSESIGDEFDKSIGLDSDGAEASDSGAAPAEDKGALPSDIGDTTKTMDATTEASAAQATSAAPRRPSRPRKASSRGLAADGTRRPVLDTSAMAISRFLSIINNRIEASRPPPSLYQQVLALLTTQPLCDELITLIATKDLTADVARKSLIEMYPHISIERTTFAKAWRASGLTKAASERYPLAAPDLGDVLVMMREQRLAGMALSKKA